MNLVKTTWEPLDDIEPTMGGAQSFREQPGFGFGVGFNEPTKLWHPYLVLTLWHWVFQIGWLY